MKLTRVGETPSTEKIGYGIKFPSSGYIILSFLALAILSAMMVDLQWLPTVLSAIVVLFSIRFSFLMYRDENPFKWDYLYYTSFSIPCTKRLYQYKLDHPVMQEAIEDYKADPHREANKAYWTEIFDNISNELYDLNQARRKMEIEQTRLNKNYINQIKEERKLLGLDK